MPLRWLYASCAHAFARLAFCDKSVQSSECWMNEAKSQQLYIFFPFFPPSQSIAVMQSGLNCVHFVKIRIIDDSMHNASNSNVSIFLINWFINNHKMHEKFADKIANRPMEMTTDKWERRRKKYRHTLDKVITSLNVLSSWHNKTFYRGVPTRTSAIHLPPKSTLLMRVREL